MIKGWFVVEYWDMYTKYEGHHKTKAAGAGVVMPCEWSAQHDVPFCQPRTEVE